MNNFVIASFRQLTFSNYFSHIFLEVLSKGFMQKKSPICMNNSGMSRIRAGWFRLKITFILLKTFLSSVILNKITLAIRKRERRVIWEHMCQGITKPLSHKPASMALFMTTGKFSRRLIGLWLQGEWILPCTKYVHLTGTFNDQFSYKVDYTVWWIPQYPMNYWLVFLCEMLPRL